MKISNPLMRGFYAGLIAGCVGGMGVTIIRILEVALSFPIIVYPYFLEFDMIINHLGYSISAHGIFGGIFGIIYLKFYNRIPSKGVKKGLIFGSIIFLIANLTWASSNFISWLFIGIEQSFIWAYEFLTAGFFIWIPYGILLGVIYEKWK